MKDMHDDDVDPRSDPTGDPGVGVHAAMSGTTPSSARTDDARVTYFAVYRAEESGPVDADEGSSAICVAMFTDYDDAIEEARAYLQDGYSISIDIGEMSQQEWDAIEEVPDDFRPQRKTNHVDR